MPGLSREVVISRGPRCKKQHNSLWSEGEQSSETVCPHQGKDKGIMCECATAQPFHLLVHSQNQDPCLQITRTISESVTCAIDVLTRIHLFAICCTSFNSREFGGFHMCIFTVASVSSWQQWKSCRTLLGLPRVSAKQATLKYLLLYFALDLNGYMKDMFTLKIPLKYLTFVCWVAACLNHCLITLKPLFH